MRRRIALVTVVLAAVALTACSGGDAALPEPSTVMPGAARLVDDPFSGGYPTYLDEPSGLRLIFGTPDLGAGTSRVAFALFDETGLITFPTLSARTFRYPNGPEAPRTGPAEETTVRYHPFPFGTRGTFTGMLDLAAAGLWGLEVAVPRPDGTVRTILVPVEVVEETRAVAIGVTAPASQNRTAADVAWLAELTTSPAPDPALYGASIADLLGRGQPFVVAFASPAFCTTALCGPQVELLSELVPVYGDQVNFVHIDLYENPHEIQGDLTRARRSPLLDEWGVTGDQWTFVVDANGRVAARFESYAARDELEPAILAVIAGR
ncbi:MAG: hypothetical protein O2798_06180 [Chloroflexi bacterium]|nr:hypothetical protein [Chloroflexota bacterium]MDA1240417.1 hypothetical protein [Chloroflexota bacterium]